MELARQTLSVVFVLALLGVLLWMLKKKGMINVRRASRSGTRSLELLERLPLTTHHSIHLVRVGDRKILLGVHSASLTLLCDVAESRCPE